MFRSSSLIAEFDVNQIIVVETIQKELSQLLDYRNYIDIQNFEAYESAWQWLIQ